MDPRSWASTRTEFSIHPETRIGRVALKVANLEDQLAFYQHALGFRLHWRAGNQAGLGAGGEDLLHLVELSSARRYRRTTGLYHFAILLPSRKELARVIARLFDRRIQNYPTDHIMTKTTYLDDPEGNGVELYTESPEDGRFAIEDGDLIARRADGSLSDGREVLDLEALFSFLEADKQLDLPLPADTRLGHIHLHVRDVQEAVDFYHGLLGLDLMGQSDRNQMAFVSAGGYHHHIGLNAWQGVGAPPPPADAVGLQYFSIRLPNRNALDQVNQRLDSAGVATSRTDEELWLQDPSQNELLLTIDQGNKFEEI